MSTAKKKNAPSTRDIRRTMMNAFIGFHGMPQYLQEGADVKLKG